MTSSNDEDDQTVQFYSLYMGSTYVTDAEERNALKMAARMVLEQDEEILKTACEVSIQVAPRHIRAVSLSTATMANSEMSEQKVLFELPYHRVSACFILREDPKVVSIGVTDTNLISHAHVFLLTTGEKAERLVAAVLKRFSHSLESAKVEKPQIAAKQQQKPTYTVKQEMTHVHDETANNVMMESTITTQTSTAAILLDCYNF